MRLRDMIRFLIGRIAFERSARLTAVSLAADPEVMASYGNNATYAAECIYAFLLTGEFPH
jgi:hypothetical protein